ncbi:MAG: succinate dehydrogenase, hydrophobic membrane anchor protein [Pseudomonadota bacterium]
MDQDFRTPLSRVRGLGSAKDGTQHFWHQRLTAMANVVLIGFFVWTIVALNNSGWEETVAYLSQPFVAIVMVMVLGAGIYHMKLGMQVIIEDYVHGAAGKALLIANTFFAIAIAAACLFAVLKLGFGTVVPIAN